MSRFTRLGRLAAAAALVASGAAVFSAAPAGAVTTLTVDCVQQHTSASVDNGATLTITISGTNCGNVIFDNNPSATHGTVTVDGNPLALGSSAAVTNGTVIVFTAPATGSDQNELSFWPSLQSPPPIAYVHITYPAPTGSIVDNGDGTANVAYSGEVVLFLMAPGTTCPADLTTPPQFLYVADATGGSPFPLPASPFVLSTSTSMHPGGAGGSALVAAGSYQACMFDAMGAGLLSSAAVTLGTVVPVPVPVPVTPSFTG